MVAESKKGKSIEPGAEFSGTTTTPSYRSADFLDPKSRAKSTGVEYAQALIALGGDDEDLARENVKDDLGGKGEITLTVDAVDEALENSKSVEKVIVAKRTGQEVKMKPGRDY